MLGFNFIKKGAKALKRGLFGSQDDIYKGLSKNIKEGTDRYTEGVKFLTGDEKVLDNIAENINNGKYLDNQKNRTKWIDKNKNRLNNEFQTSIAGKEDELIENFRKESLNKWDAEHRYKENRVFENKPDASPETIKKTEKMKKEYEKLQNQRNKYESNLTDDNVMNTMESNYREGKYKEHVNTSARYKFEEVDVTDKNIVKNKDENMLNPSEKVQFIVDEKGNKVPYKAYQEGVIKEGDNYSAKKLYDPDFKSSDYREKGGIFHRSSKGNKLSRHYDRTSPATSYSRMVNMGVGIGITGAGVLAMSNNRGQQSNAQLYGQY